MMYLVSYTLDPPRPNLGLIGELENSPDWWHYLDDQWIIATAELADDVYRRLRPHLRQTDLLLIIEIKQAAEFQGWLPKDAWDWLNNTMPQWARA